jgi:hypothetical protein
VSTMKLQENVEVSRHRGLLQLGCISRRLEIGCVKRVATGTLPHAPSATSGIVQSRTGSRRTGGVGLAGTIAMPDAPSATSGIAQRRGGSQVTGGALRVATTTLLPEHLVAFACGERPALEK